MGSHDVHEGHDDRRLRAFMQAVLQDLQALEAMLEAGHFEEGVRRIGAEQEMFLVDASGRPKNVATELLPELDTRSFTTELARFNLEANLQPHVYGGGCLSALESEAKALLARVREVAARHDTHVLLTGILPTLRQEDLGLDSMTPNPRYRQLNDAMARLRGGDFSFRIKGIDELELSHDNVMLEACNTSFQVHFQVSADEFARLYNLAQAITGPVLAAAVNSPILLGRRLWHETRVALFQQSVDARPVAHMERGMRPRVSFGKHWVEQSVVEIFREDIARFRVVLATDVDEDPLAAVARGEAPALSALRLHNGTVYRWNRPCYGISDGKPHLRIENRALPAGPTVVDEVANAAFFFGLMSAFAESEERIEDRLEFDDAKGNFLAAARHGLQAQFRWLDGERLPAARLILDELLPTAERGLVHAGIDREDIDRFLGIVHARVATHRTGSEWLLRSWQELEGSATPQARLCTLVRATLDRQVREEPVHTWTLASPTEVIDWTESYRTIGQFMSTDLFTVRPEDLVDLAASMMDWEHIRHVPVEDDHGQLVGLVSHRALLRMVGKGLSKDAEPVAVKEIMRPDPLSVSPETSTLEAIQLMRDHKLGCLPVTRDGRLVGIVTERDFLAVAARLFEQQLRARDHVVQARRDVAVLTPPTTLAGPDGGAADTDPVGADGQA